VISVSIAGVAGGFARRGEVLFLATKGGYLLLGIFGALITLLYDVLTTLSYPLTAGFSGIQIWGALLAGLGLSGLHVLSNGLIFAILVPQILRAVHTHLGITEVIK